MGLFIDASKLSLKAVLLNNGNKLPSIPVAHAVYMNETYHILKQLLEKINYSKYGWQICADLKVVSLPIGLQLGYTNVAKIKEGVSVGLQIKQLFSDPKFAKLLRSKEKQVWDAFYQIATNFLGNDKAENYKDLLEDMLALFQDFGCNMSLNIRFLDSHLIFFPDNCGQCYRKLNKVVVKDRFPLPLIEDILDRLQGSRVFSTIDLKNAFLHVDVNKDSRKYTSFVTHEGQYQFLKVPFGLCNSPAVFQRYINTIFRPLINDGIVLPYLDDVIILSSSFEEGIERVERVLSIASEYGLEINFNKSHFLKKRIEFLGHVIEDCKIFPSTLRTKAVLNFPEPANLKQIHSFLGLTVYFRKFISKYSTIARPLSDLLKKDRKFKFGEEERVSFNQLKLMLAEKLVLRIYNPNYETELHTDGSLDGYGAILMQKSPDDKNFHPTYYMSKNTTDAEKKYSSYELEALAVIEAVKKFRVYLLGIPFKIVTDCSALEKTMQKKDLVTRVARWALLLEEFDYVIEHRSGTRMTHVDALSRSPINIFCISFDNILPRLKSAQDNDNEVKAIKELLRISVYENYCDRNGILYKFVEGKKLVVVPDSIQTEIIRNAHERGHTGVKYTEKHLQDYYYIHKLSQKVEKIISNCVYCILINHKRGKKEGLLHPLQKRRHVVAHVSHRSSGTFGEYE
ncbi:Retrovirus-related Pol polyprotein from transposon 297 [Araneus ventricosus]|uniref:RNA-directed DNA polymerase n=1 Tax=Araneus ventricosus TaxID=182803 RepID=A0A4Y2DSV0_ARAVE|nr:Retrovirus-related Pol polyprotein from transposon 297 [Araneus ventricosus]